MSVTKVHFLSSINVSYKYYSLTVVAVYEINIYKQKLKYCGEISTLKSRFSTTIPTQNALALNRDPVDENPPYNTTIYANVLIA
jgi:hypothetical protein